MYTYVFAFRLLQSSSFLNLYNLFLDKAVSRFTLLLLHDALTLLKNSANMPKLLYTWRTSKCSGSLLLGEFDRCLRDGLTRILNADRNDDHWLQVSLPVRNDGLWIKNATKLAPSARMQFFHNDFEP